MAKDGFSNLNKDLYSSQKSLWGIFNIIPLISAVGVSLVFYLFARFFFLFSNYSDYSNKSLESIASVFIDGVWYDLSAVFLLTFPFILVSLVPIKEKLYRKYEKIYLSIIAFVLIPVSSLNIIDSVYVRFSGRRSDVSILNMQNDLGDQFVHIFQQFWPYYLMLIAYLILYYKSLKMLNLKFSLSGLIHQLFSTNLSLKGTAKYVCMILLILATSTLAIRGGLIRKPLSPTHAYIDGDNGFANLRLNSVFTLIKSNLDARVETPKYMAIDEAIKTLDLRGDGDQPIPPKVISFEQKPNIVLIIVESLSTEYMGIVDDLPNYTPFLSSLAQRSVFFPNFFANGRRSIDSVPSLLFSLPNYLREPFVNSPYRSNRIEGLGSQLKKINYDSYFFHGGKNGTMFFDVMAYKAGFDRYYGLEEYPEKDHFDGAWGIYDSYYFDYFANELDRHYLENPSKPFFATLFSLSSHNPYKIPPELNDRYKDGTLNIHKSIRYADDSLRKLFIKLKKLKWYENTVFFITGDHAAELDSAKYNNRYGKYMVPMIVYSPKIKPYMDLRIAHQLDFSPTVLSLVGGDIKRLNKFGNNLLSGTTGSSSSFSFYRSGRVFKLISQNGEVTISEDGSINWKDSIKDMIIRDGTTLSFPYSQFNKITSSTVNRSREVDEMILKSTVQYHHQSMNEDRF